MIRLLADENFQGLIVRGVLAAKPDADIVRVQDTEMLSASDPDLLEWAASQGHILLTHDVNTMPGFAYARVKAGLPMTGVFVINRDAPIGKVIENIVLLIECSAAEDWENQFSFLPL